MAEITEVYAVYGFGELQITVYDSAQANKEMKELRAMYDDVDDVFCYVIKGNIDAHTVADMIESKKRDGKPVGRKFFDAANAAYGVTVDVKRRV